MNPEERVRAFIASYLRAHEQFHAEGLDGRPLEQFERWDALVSELDSEHGINSGCMPLAGVIHGDSPHHPDNETIIGTRFKDSTAFVETKVEGLMAQYHEYELLQSDGDWRIHRIWDFLVAADAPLVHERESHRFAAPPILPLRRLPEDDADADGDALFVPGRQIRIGDAIHPIEVRAVGQVSLPTGRLVVGDLGYDAGMLNVLGQAVPPGGYAAEVALCSGRVAALRLRISDRPAVKWAPADHNGGRSTSYIIGVDAGNVAIMDLSAVTGVTSRDKDRAFEVFAANQAARYCLLSLASENDTVISDSGWGDGGYPVYWGLDGKGQPCSLVVDFLLGTREARGGSKPASPWWKFW